MHPSTSPDATILPLARADTAARLRALKQRAIALLEVRPGMSVLDVGCGEGADVRTLAGLVAPSGRAVGVDHDAERINAARRRAAEAGVAAADWRIR